ncbi:hypothetical protein [Streptomyces hypolithicus]
MSRATAEAVRPAGLSICWEPKPDTPVRCCTIQDPQHDGDHFHEYPGASWSRDVGEKR